MTTTSYYSRIHWQCWMVPQVFLTRGRGSFAVGFRWLFWGASVTWGDV